ncbi:hypothetical protein LTR66_007807 [Elasticomyces elasticus]|nr:hypothetical protein LTR66_007807 [Elasticomyces elasticus]
MLSLPPAPGTFQDAGNGSHARRVADNRSASLRETSTFSAQYLIPGSGPQPSSPPQTVVNVREVFDPESDGEFPSLERMADLAEHGHSSRGMTGPEWETQREEFAPLNRVPSLSADARLPLTSGSNNRRESGGSGSTDDSVEERLRQAETHASSYNYGNFPRGCIHPVAGCTPGSSSKIAEVWGMTEGEARSLMLARARDAYLQQYDGHGSESSDLGISRSSDTGSESLAITRRGRQGRPGRSIRFEDRKDEGSDTKQNVETLISCTEQVQTLSQDSILCDLATLILVLGILWCVLMHLYATVLIIILKMICSSALRRIRGPPDEDDDGSPPSGKPRRDRATDEKEYHATSDKSRDDNRRSHTNRSDRGSVGKKAALDQCSEAHHAIYSRDGTTEEKNVLWLLYCSDVGSRTGVSRRTLYSRLRLNNIATKIQDLHNGRVSEQSQSLGTPGHTKLQTTKTLQLRFPGLPSSKNGKQNCENFTNLAPFLSELCVLRVCSFQGQRLRRSTVIFHGQLVGPEEDDHIEDDHGSSPQHIEDAFGTSEHIEDINALTCEHVENIDKAQTEHTEHAHKPRTPPRGQDSRFSSEQTLDQDFAQGGEPMVRSDNITRPKSFGRAKRLSKLVDDDQPYQRYSGENIDCNNKREYADEFDHQAGSTRVYGTDRELNGPIGMSRYDWPGQPPSPKPKATRSLLGVLQTSTSTSPSTSREWTHEPQEGALEAERQLPNPTSLHEPERRDSGRTDSLSRKLTVPQLHATYIEDTNSDEMAANNGMYPGVGGAMLPSAGHHMDMNHLMSVVTSLSQQLAENREAFVRMQESMARLRVSDGFDLNLPGNAGIVEEYCEEMFGDWKSRLYREGDRMGDWAWERGG